MIVVYVGNIKCVWAWPWIIYFIVNVERFVAVGTVRAEVLQHTGSGAGQEALREENHGVELIRYLQNNSTLQA